MKKIIELRGKSAVEGLHKYVNFYCRITKNNFKRLSLFKSLTDGTASNQFRYIFDSMENTLLHTIIVVVSGEGLVFFMVLPNEYLLERAANDLLGKVEKPLPILSGEAFLLL